MKKIDNKKWFMNNNFPNNYTHSKKINSQLMIIKSIVFVKDTIESSDDEFTPEEIASFQQIEKDIDSFFSLLTLLQHQAETNDSSYEDTLIYLLYIGSDIIAEYCLTFMGIFIRAQNNLFSSKKEYMNIKHCVELIKKVKKPRQKGGQIKHKNRYGDIISFVTDIYEKQKKIKPKISILQIAKIADSEVMKRSDFNKTLSYDNAFNTIYKWLRDYAKSKK